MKAPRYECYTTAGRAVGVTTAAIESSIKSTAAIDAVLRDLDPGFSRVIGFIQPRGKLMTASGAVIETLSLILTSNWDGDKYVEWVNLASMEMLEKKGQALLAAAEAARAEAIEAAARSAARAAVLEAAALEVVPIGLRAEWLAAVEAERFAFCRSPLTSHVIRVGGGCVAGFQDGRLRWDTAKAPSGYDGGSGYGSNSDD